MSTTRVKTPVVDRPYGTETQKEEKNPFAHETHRSPTITRWSEKV
jgi:hypothetical protein